MGLELQVEALIAEYSFLVASLMKNGAKTDSRNILEAACPAIDIQILQNLSMAEEGHPKIIEGSFIPSRLDAATGIGLSIQNLTFSGLFLKSETRIQTTIHTLSLNLDYLSKSESTPSSGDTIFSLQLVGLDADHNASQFRLRWIDLTTMVGHRGPELVTAVAISLNHEFLQSLRTLRLIERHDEAVIQSVAYRIIHFSESIAIIDPLSTIQPSYLVQKGIPHALRTDSTFRFLFHLRHCLRHLRPEDHKHIFTGQGNADSINPDTFASALHSRFVHLDQDFDTTYDLTLLERLLKIKRAKPAASASHRVPTLSVVLQSTCLRICAPTSSLINEFLLTGVQIHTRSYPLGLIQHTLSHLPSMSQTSLREKRLHQLERHSIRIAINRIYFAVHSHLMDFVQHVLRVRRIYVSHSTAISSKYQPANRKTASIINSGGSSSVFIDVSLLLHSVKLQAAAANLTFVIGAQNIQIVSLSSVPTNQGDESMNITLLLDKLYLQARSPLYKMKPGVDQDILAAFDLNRGKANAVIRQEQNIQKITRVVFSLGGLYLSVPRSAIKLYRFVEEWRADFLTGIEQAINAALSELHIPSKKTQSPVPSIRSFSKRPMLQINGQVIDVGISLQVMHGTWLSWRAIHVVTYAQSSSDPFNPSNIVFGLQITSSTLEISSQNNGEAVSDSRVKLAFPALSLGGSHDGRSVQALIIIDFLDLKVKPSHWDTLLAVQQKFGQDFNDLVTLMEETRLKASKFSRKSQSSSRPKFGGYLKMRGFRIGLEGFSSTMFLECQDIGGGLQNNNGFGWDIGLTDLALSLALRKVGSMQESFNRGHRSFFVIIDVKVLSGKQRKYPYARTLDLVITKAHAVMHPSSIGEIGDFLDQIQVRAVTIQTSSHLTILSG